MPDQVIGYDAQGKPITKPSPSSPSPTGPIKGYDASGKPVYDVPKQPDSGFWSNLLGPTLQGYNPMNFINPISQLVSHPIDFMNNLQNAGIKGAVSEFGKGMQGLMTARDAYNTGGDKLGVAELGLGGLGHLAAAAIPGMGPQIANVGEEVRDEGVTSKTAGETLGLVFPFTEGPNLISKGMGMVARVTGASKLPAIIAETGLGIPAAINKEFNAPGQLHDIGQTLIDNRIFRPTGKKPGQLISTIDAGIKSDAARARGFVNPSQVMDFAENYSNKMGDLDIPTASQVSKNDAMSAYRQRFMDANTISDESLQPRWESTWGNNPADSPFHPDRYDSWTNAQGAEIPLNATDLLGIKRTTGKEANWGAKVSQDPTRMGEFMDRGTSLGARQGMEDLFTANGFESAIDRLKQEQRLMGVQAAAENRAYQSPVLRRSLEMGAAGEHIAQGTMAKALWPIMLMEGIRNPTLTATFGNLTDMGAKAAFNPNLFRASLLSRDFQQ